MAAKRKNESDLPGRKRKRVRLSTAASPVAENDDDAGPSAPNNGSETANVESKRKRIVKLAPPRPFPTVPRSVSATGPRSAHKEGKNLICISRKTTLATYMRRCKDLFMKDGYTSLHLSAMGAAIPHLLKLALALPPILPYSADDIHIDYTTDTVHVQDEIVPDDEEEDISYQTRGKSTLKVVISIPSAMGKGASSKGNQAQSHGHSNPAPGPAQDDEVMETV